MPAGRKLALPGPIVVGATRRDGPTRLPEIEFSPFDEVPKPIAVPGGTA